MSGRISIFLRPILWVQQVAVTPSTHGWQRIGSASEQGDCKIPSVRIQPNERVN